MRTLARTVMVGAVVTAVAMVVGAHPAGAAPAQVFTSCDDARAAGYSNIPVGQPGYNQALDADGDGFACEDDEGAAAATPAVPLIEEPGSTSPAPEPAPEVLGQSMEALPVTGVGWSTVYLLAAAMLLLAMGRRLMSAGYEHQDWYAGRREEVRFTVDSVTRRTRRR